MSLRYSSCFSFSSPNIRSFSTSENPMIAFSGVRSSCDMLARNSDPGGGKVVDVDGLSVQDGAARNPSTAYRSTRELHRPPDRSVMHREVELFPLPQHDH